MHTKIKENIINITYIIDFPWDFPSIFVCNLFLQIRSCTKWIAIRIVQLFPRFLLYLFSRENDKILFRLEFISNSFITRALILFFFYIYDCDDHYINFNCVSKKIHFCMIDVKESRYVTSGHSIALEPSLKRGPRCFPNQLLVLAQWERKGEGGK